MNPSGKPKPRSPQSLMPCDPCCNGLIAALPANSLPAIYCEHRKTFAIIEGRYLRLHPAQSVAEAEILLAELHKAAAIGDAIAQLIVLQLPSAGDSGKPS
jgi:hypothetical protein